MYLSYTLFTIVTDFKVGLKFHVEKKIVTQYICKKNSHRLNFFILK